MPPLAAVRQASATRTASELAGTSCTRAHQAPAAAARAVTATVASSLPVKGRAVPSGAASSRPRKRLREAPTSTGKAGPVPPRRDRRSRFTSSAQLCAGFLAKPSPGSTTIIEGSTPCRDDRVDPLAQFRAHLADDIGVDGPVLHLVAVPAPVHDDIGHARLGHQARHVRIGQAAAHVVDQAGTGVHRGSGHLGAHGVHADRHVLAGQPRDHRDDPAEFLVGR